MRLRSDRLLEHCSIALVGKYTKFSDSYASVIKALEHSALAISHKLEVKVSVPSGLMILSKNAIKDELLLRCVEIGKTAVYSLFSNLLGVFIYFIFFSFPCQYIDSADLEPATLQEEPVKYHEAWQKLCSAE